MDAAVASAEEGEEDGRNEEEEEREEEDNERKEKEDYERVLQSRFRTLIFTPKQTIKGLCDLMSSKGQRGRMVNWTYLGKEERGGAQTVEFRQHEGCLDAEGVRGWVRFCGELVRWAGRGAEAEAERRKEERGGEEEDGEGDKERERERERWLEELYGSGILGVEDLVERMGLEGESRDWVEKRVGMWKED